MVTYYAYKIEKGLLTFNQVPTTYQPAVKSLFRTKVANGEITPEQYEQYVGEPYEG
ncbi:hypothetical protein [Geobacillus stearothermophilus]|uniref:XkdX family protein n=1 Tax=Geobacillus stearothermophilus TaxID=1422 RepID=A0A150MQ32_GEOSE|nr:hypothetical protein [Geobacillus stearothermophilus]KYD26544.1 hypothetical protein B4109_3163 [Geobacillus stearothermophilus]